MAGRTVLVTGGTGGIGKATALRLAAMGAQAAVTGRDPARAHAAARAIQDDHGVEVMVFVANWSSQSEVRRLADEVQEVLPRLDVLVNNVGGYWNTRHVTVDGLEHTFALNHLAPFLLTNLLVEPLDSATLRPASSRSPPTRRRRGASTSTTSKANVPTRVRGPTTSPNSPTSCSPTSWPDG